MASKQTHSDAKKLWIEAWNLSDCRERIRERLDQMGANYDDGDIAFFELVTEEGTFVYGSILMRLIVSKLTPKQAAPWSKIIDEVTYAEAAQAASITAQCLHKKATRLRKRLIKSVG